MSLLPGNPGIYAGIGAAALMACSYISSGWALRRTPGLTPLGLFFNACQGMLLVCLVGIFPVWHPDLIHKLGSYIWPLLGIVVAYSSGQFLIMRAQRDVDASRVVPLLGLKLPMLALINLLAFHQHFNLLQVAAIALTVLAAFVLNNAGTRIGWRNFALVIFGCLLYCLSDTCINLAVERLQTHVFAGDLSRASIANTFLVYMACGVMGALAVRLGPPEFRVRGAALHALPFALSWVPGVILLSICFGFLGTVGGNIIQASRGLLAILFVQIFSWLGFYRVDAPVPMRVVLRRCLAALMIILAATLYNLKP